MLLALLIACTPEVVCEWSDTAVDTGADADIGVATTTPSTPTSSTVATSSTPTPDTARPTADTAPPVETGSGGSGGSGSTSAGCGDPGIAGPGFVWTIWPDAHTGDEHTTQPKTDAHDGLDGDNPEYRRHNVSRAHIDYWYTSSYQDAGEPDPNGEQWVDYAPDFATLGAGQYEIVAHYRQTENRAPYEALYKVQHRDGEAIVGRDQREGDDYESLSLGVYDLCPGDFVRVEDPGANSISFNQMDFIWVGP